MRSSRHRSFSREISMHPIGPIALGWVMLIGGFIVYSRFLRVLREDHREVFRELGDPSLFYLGSKPTQNLVRFIRNREYRALGDASLTRTGDLIIVTQICGIAALIWLFWPLLAVLWRLVGRLLA